MTKKPWFWFVLGVAVAYVLIRWSAANSTNTVGAFVDKLVKG